MIALTNCDRLLILRILGTEAVVLLLETLGYSLKGDVPLDLALFIELYACLKLRKLRLLALSKCALCGPSGDTGLACRVSKVPTEDPDTCSGRADHWHQSPGFNPFKYSENKRDCRIITSFCWTGAGAKSFFGLRPGLGLAGMTHSFEASNGMVRY